MRALVAVMLLASGCSMTMKRLDPEWDGRSEPVCDDGIAPTIIDAVASGVGTVIVVNEASKPDTETNATLGISSAIVALAFLVSSVIGERAASRCDDAKLAWRSRQGG